MTLVRVVGAGVVGLTCAVTLEDAGHDVTVVADDGPRTSDVAGGLWMPYAAGADERVPDWAAETRAALIRDGDPVVDYVHLEASRPDWLDLVPDARPATAAERRGRPSGWVAPVPLVELPRHLRALEDRLRRPIVRARVDTLDPDGADVVVNAAGLAGGRLAGDDDTLVPVRGQVVRMAAPAGTPCVCDEDELTYVLPRADVCVVGGTHQPGDADARVRERETAELVARARALVPELAAAPVLGAAAGIRPTRPAGPRVERVGDVVHCYGHGGAGLTLSVGCAHEVVRLVWEA